MGISLANNEIGCATFVKASHLMVKLQMKYVKQNCMFISYFRRYNVMKSSYFSDKLLNFHTISIHIHGKFMLESISRIHILLQFETVKFSPHSISMILAQKFANLSLKIMKHREKFIHVFHSWNKKSQSRSIHVNFHHNPSLIRMRLLLGPEWLFRSNFRILNSASKVSNFLTVKTIMKNFNALQGDWSLKKKIISS